jgi:hypothetical protein
MISRYWKYPIALYHITHLIVLIFLLRRFVYLCRKSINMDSLVLILISLISLCVGIIFGLIIGYIIYGDPGEH